MKKILLLALTLAVATLFAEPVLAEHEHNHEKDTQAEQSEAAEPAEKMSRQESMMQESIEKMRAQMEKINKSKKPKERRKLLQEHSKSMRDSIEMMREMMGGMAMCDAMGSGHMMGKNMAGDHKMCDHKSDGHSASHSGSSADTAPVASSKLDQISATDKTTTNPAKKLWVCPMHPEVVQDHPGVCPICGMDLVEMEQPGASQPEHRHPMDGDMKCNDIKGDCMEGGGMKGGGMDGMGMKGGCMKCRMKGMMEKRMDMMLMLMEQMVEHNEAEMAGRK